MCVVLKLSGASVATTARSEPAAGQAPALSIKADLGTARGVQNVVDRIQHAWGGLDVLVNNVDGTETRPGGFEVLSDEDWQRILELNLVTRLDEEPHVNPNTHTREFSLRDPDGYYVTISALSAA